jgi:hypothetical protein
MGDYEPQEISVTALRASMVRYVYLPISINNTLKNRQYGNSHQFYLH